MLAFATRHRETPTFWVHNMNAGNLAGAAADKARFAGRYAVLALSIPSHGDSKQQALLRR